MTLILTRKIGESVVLYNDVYCKILGVSGNQVRLGFDAPRRIVINREEIHKRIANGEPKPNKKDGLKISAFAALKNKFNFQSDGNIAH